MSQCPHGKEGGLITTTVHIDDVCKECSIIVKPPGRIEGLPEIPDMPKVFTDADAEEVYRRAQAIRDLPVADLPTSEEVAGIDPPEGPEFSSDWHEEARRRADEIGDMPLADAWPGPEYPEGTSRVPEAFDADLTPQEKIDLLADPARRRALRDLGLEDYRRSGISFMGDPWAD